MPNYNNIGETLQGLASIIAGVRGIADPNRKKREQLMTDLQSNPLLLQRMLLQGDSAIEALKPRFGGLGGNKSQQKLADILHNAKADPDTQRLLDIQKLQQKQRSGATLTDEENSQLQEFSSYGRILTPQERESKKLDIETTKKRNEEATITLGLKKQEAEEKAKEKKRIEDSRKISYPAIARITQGNKNLWEEGFVNGKLSADERNALYVDPEVRSRLDDERQAYLDKVGMQAGQQARYDNMLAYAVNDLMKDAGDAGISLGLEDAKQIVQNPTLAESNPKLKAIIDKRREYNRKKVLPSANAGFRAATQSTFNDIKMQDGEPTPEQLNFLNQQAQLYYGGTSFQPPVFGNKIIASPKWFNKNNKSEVFGIISVDPELKKAFPDVPIQEPNTNNKKIELTQEQKAQNYESLKKKYPNETPQQLAARVEKGEK